MVKELKIYMGNLKKKISKLKLKKTVATFGLATSILCTLAGCGNESDYSFAHLSKPLVSYDSSNQSNTNVSTNTSINTNTNTSINTNTNSVYQAPAIEYSTLDFNNILYSNEANNYFQNYIKSLGTVKYDYSEMFNVERALELYNKEDRTEVVHSHDFLKGSTTVDVDKLYDVVVANNKAYLKNNSVSLCKEFSKSELTKILVIVADTINAYVKEHPNVDLESLSCTLGDLKVLNKTSTSNAYVSSDGVLTVNPPMLNILIKQCERKGIDAYRNTIMHETIHLIQRACKDERTKNPGVFVGMSRKYADLDMNPLSFDWFYESAAEKNVSNMTGDEPIVYSTMITYLNSLNLANFLNDKNSVEAAESLDSYKDLEGLFEMFGATTQEEKIEIINMMVAINIIQVEPSDFVKKYEQSYRKTFSETDVYTEVKCTIKSEIMQTLTRYFYKNLSQKIANKELAMEDIFALITIFENDICKHAKYNDSNYKDYNEAFINYYVQVQNELFHAMSLNGYYSFEEIENEFENYTLQAYDEENNLQSNYSFNWMTDKKFLYIKDFESNIVSNNHESIRHNLERVYRVSNQLIK